MIAGLRDPERRRTKLRQWSRDPNMLVYGILLVGAIVFPPIAAFATGTSVLTSLVADAGVWVLLAIGLNVVVGFAGLLDLGYAAFFAIGAYTYALFASAQLRSSPLHEAIHLPFWILLIIAMLVAATFGAALGAPTLRLRGDYLAIVTLGFGEIVPRVFRNDPGGWTGGINAIGGIDQPTLPICLDGPWSKGDSLGLKFGGVDCSFNTSDPTAYYVLMVLLVIGCVILVTNLQTSRLGRAWAAVREDEVAAAAMGVNTRNIKLLAFAIGAAFSGFGGAYYGAKLSLVSPDNFDFTVSITVLVMVVLGGMGNIPGVIVGALAVYFLEFKFLTDLPHNARNLVDAVGLGHALDPANPATGWPGIEDFVGRLNYLVLGLILVTMMLLRPQGLLPSRVREQELKAEGAADDSVFDQRAGQT
ncbi:MAG: ABC transporter ATP-binding protein [Candidatus Dormibacteraeota bacterium]|nr:ABC transporter ATP-binding protein [Candidatus Dormibacteraeota bacterium]